MRTASLAMAARMQTPERNDHTNNHLVLQSAAFFTLLRTIQSPTSTKIGCGLRFLPDNASVLSGFQIRARLIPTKR